VVGRLSAPKAPELSTGREENLPNDLLRACGIRVQQVAAFASRRQSDWLLCASYDQRGEGVNVVVKYFVS